MPKALAVTSLKTEKGLSQLNELLSDRTYVGGTAGPTREDLDYFLAILSFPNRQQFPHLCRWYQHVAALRAQRADYFAWPGSEEMSTEKAAKKGRDPGKEKKQMEVDCVVQTVADKRQPAPGAIAATAGSACFPDSSSAAEGRYYITTAINYANGWPHIGHAYEALTADMFARYHRLLGQDVFYLTGADEHGQKIADAAQTEGMKPIDICDRYCLGFQALNQRLHVSNDHYVRTTSDAHKTVARAIWKICKDNGDIYLGRYEGWYLVREERFVTDQEAEEWGFKDPGSGKPLTKMSEPSFFFRLSKYQQAVLKLFEDNEDFLQPKQYRTEILERLKSIELRDLSISRGTFSWGIPCPEEAVEGKEHVMYVWFDALINYMSAINGHDASNPLSRFWPADMHIIGKDISWFHTVIWPAMLLSAGLKPAKSVVVHGFISGPDGRKMSKSYGNVVDPHDMLDKYPSDTVRWYLARESPYGDDVKFSETSMKLMHNADLCDNLGNLVNRAVNLCGGTVPECDAKLVPSLPFDLAELKTSSREAFEKFRLSEAADLTVRACSTTNKWIADLEPWKMKGEDKQALRTACLRLLLEAVYVLAHFFAPFIPVAAEAIFKKLGTSPKPIPKLSDSFMNLTSGTAVISGSVLFAVQDTKADIQGSVQTGGSTQDGSKDKAETKPNQSKPKEKAKETKDATQSNAKGAAPKADDPNQPLFSKLEVRVGKVVKAWHHPEAERLFCEEIDVGDPGGPRQIVSGLREHYSLKEFEGRRLLVVCNMKPAKLRNVMSNGMVLCAKNASQNKLELLGVPDDCKIGDRVLPQGVPFTWKPADPSAVKKLAIWEEVAKELKTNSERVACYAGTTLTTEAGISFLAPSMGDAPIS